MTLELPEEIVEKIITLIEAATDFDIQYAFDDYNQLVIWSGE